MPSADHGERLPDAFLSDLGLHWTRMDEEFARGAYLAALAKGQVQSRSLAYDSIQNMGGPPSAGSQTLYMMPAMPHFAPACDMDVDMTNAGEYGSMGANIAHGFGQFHGGHFYDYAANSACTDAPSYYEDHSSYADDSSCYDDHSPYTDGYFDAADSPNTNEASSSSSSCATPSLFSSRGDTTGSESASSVSSPSAGERSPSPPPISSKKVYPVAPYYDRTDRLTHADDPNGFFWCRWRGNCNYAFHHKDSNGVYLAHFEKAHKDVPEKGFIRCQWCEKKEVVSKGYIGNHIHKGLGARFYHQRDMIKGPLTEDEEE